jgi:hypothetical protein
VSSILQVGTKMPLEVPVMNLSGETFQQHAGVWVHCAAIAVF